MKKILNLILLLSISFVIGGCEKTIDVAKLPSHNIELYKQDRYCMDYLKFECLPESKDKSWQSIEDKDFLEIDSQTQSRLTHLEQIMKMKYEERIEAMQKYVLNNKDYEFLEAVLIQNFFNKKEAEMEKQYPGFWGNTPRKVRHRWMRLCAAKANKYGYGIATTDTDGTIIPAHIVETQQFIELCARIGLYFDNDPKWQYIVDFISLPESSIRGYAGAAVDYIDFTVYNKDYSRVGDKLTDWYLKEALGHLPYPDRKVPRLND